jgi:hypothetical protein
MGFDLSPAFFFRGIDIGLARVMFTNWAKIFTGQRLLYASSFNEVMGYPGNTLTTEY